jgi:(1->4)-alpha-D-glucan 1-alpha-D-glucosylmutase
MNPPRATMRLQFNSDFTFRDARSLISYLASLGISHVYASPIMTARRGSGHGYDVVDPTEVSPVLGGEDEFISLVDELRRYELGIIVDIVPNHMAIGNENAWWMDVLAKGRESRYAKYFDIDWNPLRADLRGKILLPILARPLCEVLDAGEISLAFDSERGCFAMRYFDHVLPIAAETLLTLTDDPITAFNPASAAGRERFYALLQRQHYQLAWWRAASDEINWRRFFDINDLAAIRVEDDEVFETVHATVFRLYAAGRIDGFRVDHIDGLAQPEAYCRRMRQRLGELEQVRPAEAPPGRAYFIVEKILARKESIPIEWDVDGTTGYDFMDESSALLHDRRGEQPLGDLWRHISGRPDHFDCEEELARRQILQRSFAAQLEAAVEALYAIAQTETATQNYSRSAICRALTEILVHFRVYRIYARVGCTSPADREFLSSAVDRAGQSCARADTSLVALLGRWLAGARIKPELDQLQAVALIRFQQLTASLSAKAVEDTAFYRYGRLLSRNDVGFEPRHFASSIADFHRNMQCRESRIPHTMLATATHDHKRGEDARARLAVLSEIPEHWVRALGRWLGLSASYRNKLHDMPSTGDTAILFQTIVGAWPDGLMKTDQQGLNAYRKRLAAWQCKALREAKLYSDWAEPNEKYEAAANDLLEWIFSGSPELLAEIADFVENVRAAGAAKSLAQTLLKLTAPGVPDFYQGTEYWDFSLVDPDNRSPVDFTARRTSLAALTSYPSTGIDHRIKQFLIARVLASRRDLPDLFSKGTYKPLKIVGAAAESFIGFARVLDSTAAIILFCRFTAQLFGRDDIRDISSLLRKDERLLVPPELHGTFMDALRGEQISIGHQVDLKRILRNSPVGLLIKAPDHWRTASN